MATESRVMGQLMDCQHYGKLHKLLRVTALVKKFATQLKLLVKRDSISVDWAVTVVYM